MDLLQYVRFYTTGWNKPLHTLRADSVFDIDYGALQRQGVKLILYDADDTLGGFHTPFNDDVLELLSDVARTFHVGILSNCSGKRSEHIEEMLKGIPCFVEPSSRKPHPSGYEHIMDHFHVDSAETAMVGDKVSQDLWGAYQAGVGHRILVEPFSRMFNDRKGRVIEDWLRTMEQWLYENG